MAIEVKSSKTIHSSELLLFYGGKDPIYRDDVSMLPLKDMLKNLPQFLKSQSLR